MPESAAAVPEGSVLLHIGPHKTGTTAIQGILASAREDLAARGVTYPGTRGSQVEEARVVLGRPAGWAHDSAPLPSDDVWRRLVREVHETLGRTVLSSEFFALCNAEQRARVVDELGRERLFLLVAARNPGSIALSTWQQVLRDGKAGHLEEWLEGRFRRPEPEIVTEGFWSWADAATLVEHWGQVLDPDRIRVVVIDESDRTLLPATFEQLLGLPAATLSGRRPPSQNRSLTAPEAELLRSATALTKAQLRWDEFSLFFRMGYARRLHEARVPPADEARPVLPTWATSQATAEAAVSIERLRASGVTIIGDLEALRRIPPPAVAEPVEQVPVDLAAEALAGVVGAAQRRLRRAEGQVERQAEKLAATRRRLRRAQHRIEMLTGPAAERARTPGDIPTRELVAALRQRVLARITRRVRAPRTGRDPVE